MAEVPEYFSKLVPPGFKLAPGEFLDTCPYNSAHYCLAHKAKRHVEKCRKAYMKTHKTGDQGVEMIGCKYTDTHWVPAVEITWHQERCAFQDQPQKSSVIPVSEPKSDKLTLNDLSVDELQMMLRQDRWNGNSEDWHAEAILFEKTHHPFNPVHSMVEVGAPWCPPGLNKGERKEFRAAHRDIANVKRGGTYFLPIPKVTPPVDAHPTDYLTLKY